jgi:hypothetical protein
MDMSHDAWITKSKLSSFNAKGRLELADGRLRFSTVPGATSGGFAGWLEEMAGRPGVKDQIEAGDAVLLLDAPVEACHVTFPRAMYGRGMEIATGGKTWTIWLMYPAAPGIWSLFDLLGSRGANKPWKAALSR